MIYKTQGTEKNKMIRIQILVWYWFQAIILCLHLKILDKLSIEISHENVSDSIEEAN